MTSTLIASLILFSSTVPFMTEHRNVAPSMVVTTNFEASATHIITNVVDKQYVESLGINPEVPVTNVFVDGKSVVGNDKIARIDISGMGFATTNDIDSVESDIAGLSARVTTNETNITALTGMVSTNAENVSNLTKRVGTNETAISSLESSVSNIDVKVETNSKNIVSLSGRVRTNETDISSLKTSVSNMNTVVTNINETYVTKTQIVPSKTHVGYAENADSAKQADKADTATTADKLEKKVEDFSVTVFPSIEESEDGKSVVSSVVFSNRIEGISTSVTTLEIDGSKVITANQIAPSESVSKAAKLAETANSAQKVDDSFAGMFAVSNSVVFTNKTDKLGSTLEPDGTQVLTEALGKRQFLPQYQDGKIYHVGKNEYLDFSQTTGMSGLGGTGGEVVFGDTTELFQKEKFTFRALDSEGKIDTGGSRTSTLTPDGSAIVTKDTESDPTFSAWTNGYEIVIPNASRINLGAGSRMTSELGLAFGGGNNCSGDYASTVGWDNTAIAWRASALGSGNTASDYYSSALGNGNTASGFTSSALGSGNTASGETSSALGYGNTASGYYSSALGYYNTASGNYSSAIGYMAYNKWQYSLAFSQTPSLIYLGSSTTNSGATAKTLQSYLDKKSDRYKLAWLGLMNEINPARDALLYGLFCDTNGVSVTLPAAATYSQDFVIRLQPVDTNGTCLAEVKASDATEWQFDYPTGTNAVFGTIYAPTYFTFTQTAADRWSIFAYAATKEEE